MTKTRTIIIQQKRKIADAEASAFFLCRGGEGSAAADAPFSAKPLYL